MKKPYDSPSFSTLGSVHQMTLQTYNKVGDASDAFSATTPLVGSLIPH